jgi:hypothetical protein
VLVLYDGAIKRELKETGITERALIAAALDIKSGEAGILPAAAQ